MPIQILMPALSPTMTEGNLVRWLRKEGDTIKAGEVIAEIETDKATMEIEAVDEGTLGKIVVPAGTEGVKVNSLIAMVLEDGEDPSSLDKIVAAKPVAVPKPSEEVSPRAAHGEVEGPRNANDTGKRVFASPLARRLADQNHISLAQVPGSGPRGRVVKADIEGFLEKGGTAAITPIPMTYGDAAYDEISLTNMRKVIAKRLTESKQTIPHFYLTVQCVLDKLLAMRAELNAGLGDQKVSVNDFIVKAVAAALMKVPKANASWFETCIRQYKAADVCVAVAVDSGLVTPVLRSANVKSLTQLSAEIKALADKARSGKLMPEEYQGGSFTISNLGMYGIKEFAAIINPPQAAILAVGAGEKCPIVGKDGQLAVATAMTCTLCADHRVIDGAVGAEFLAAFKGFIENPLQLLIWK